MRIGDIDTVELQLEFPLAIELERTVAGRSCDNVAHALGSAGDCHVGTLDVDEDRAGFARHSGRIAVKGDPDGRGPGSVLHIIVIFLDILIIDDDFGRLLQGTVIQVDFLGNDFYRRLYRATTQDDINDCVHVADVDLVVTVHITGGVIITTQDDVDDSVHVADIDLIIAIHVTRHRRQRQDCHHGK